MSEQVTQQALESAGLYERSGALAMEALAEYHLGRMQLEEVSALLAEIAPLLQEVQSDIDSDLVTSRKLITAVNEIGTKAKEPTTGSVNPTAANMHTSIASAVSSATAANAHVLQALLCTSPGATQPFLTVSSTVNSLTDRLAPIADYLAAAKDNAHLAAEAIRMYTNDI